MRNKIHIRTALLAETEIRRPKGNSRKLWEENVVLNAENILKVTTASHISLMEENGRQI